MNRSARSLNRSQYSVGTAASQGRIVRQNPAPKFHPFIIIAVVITIGMVIVGLVMTVIANWPGYSSIGFNALEIVGPVILGVGGLALICTVVVVVMRNKSQRDEWQQKMIDAERTRAMYNSRLMMEPHTPTSTYSRPSRSILKKTESTSTYGRNSNVFEEGSDSGLPQTNNISYESENSRGRHPVYKIETMPDPHAARQSYNAPYPGSTTQQPGYYPQGNHYANNQPQGYSGRLNSSTESESNVPVPIRVPKTKKQGTPTKQPQYEAEAYATQEPPLARGSPLAGTPDLGYMGDRLSYTSDGAEPMESPPPQLTDKPPMARRLNSYDNTGDYDAFADPSFRQPVAPPMNEGEPDDLDRNNEARRSKRKKKKHRPQNDTNQPYDDPNNPAPPQSYYPEGQPQLTRINISAQPGTSVQITPGLYSEPQKPKKKKKPRQPTASQASAETEI